MVTVVFCNNAARGMLREIEPQQSLSFRTVTSSAARSYHFHGGITMRFRSLLGTIAGLVCVLLLAGSAMAQGGEFVRAEWGVEGRRVDVTDRVRTFIHDGVLQMEATRFALGVDPAPHENKVLIIKLRGWDGQIKDYAFPERSAVRLELDPDDWRERREEHERHERREEGYEHHERGVRILRAYYGADGQFMNVTDLLRSRIDDGHLFIHVDNYSMGGDPLPGAHKWLRVLFEIDGDRRNIVVDEKTDLRLP